MLLDGKIWVGTSENGPVYLLPSMANRHGLIAGATGTGKTVSLKVLAESFSDMGVPVFLSDVKSDLSGMVQPGQRSESLDRRLLGCGVDADAFVYQSYPTMFWDVYGEQGMPVRTTVERMGPLLLSRMLGLNETQSGVMNILFRVAHDRGDPLDDLQDLKAMLVHIGEHAKELTLNYGNVSSASVGAIQRAVAVLEDQGGNTFFGMPEINIGNWLTCDENGRGYINILAADRLFNNPTMYSTFLLWMLSALYDLLPERGDAEKPLIVFFFDEAHLLFNNCTRALMEKVEQVVRLIRSKGVGVYFITQSPADIPMTILGQLGNRIQHALRAYTPLDQKAVKVAAQTFRTNPSFDTEEAITTLKTGEALVSFLDEHGAPGVVERATILPPQSHMGAISAEERARVNEDSPYRGVYDEAVNRVSAYEQLNPAPAVRPQVVLQPWAFSAQPVMAQTIPQPTPLAAQVSTAQQNMANTFKVFNPTTGEYEEKQIEGMSPVAEAVQPVVEAVQPVVDAVQQVPQMVQQAAQPVMQAVQQAAQPVMQAVQQAPQMFQQAAQPVVQAVQQAPQMVQQAAQPVMQAVQQAAQPVVQAVQGMVQPNQQVPTIQVQPQLQQMPMLVQDPVTGQMVQQMVTVQYDPATGTYVPVQAPVDPKVLEEQQKAAEKAAKEAARQAKEAEAAARRARADELREEAAERARRNDSVAGRVKNTAISTATRQVVSSLTKEIGKAVSNLFGGNKK